MNGKQVTTMVDRMRRALDEDDLTSLGRMTRFTKRLREVTPQRLALALLAAFSIQRLETIADILRTFNALTGKQVAYKPFHNQLSKPAFPRFMAALFHRLAQRLTLKVLAPVPESALRQFSDIVIQDGSSFAVHDALATAFRGRFTAQAPAAAGVHATLSLFNDQFLRVSVTAQAEGEPQFLPKPKSLTGQLILADRGYASIDYCAAVQEAGGHFVIRFKGTVNPVIKTCRIGGRLIDHYRGVKLRDVLSSLQGRSADLDVVWARHGAEPVELRLLLLWNHQTREHCFLATNLSRRDFSPASVRALYTLRWQVELIFKELKSYANLRAFQTTKEPIARGLIWAALAAALLKRFLAHATQVVHDGLETSTRRTAMALTYKLPKVIEALMRRRGLRAALMDLLASLATNARRAHPDRDRRRGRLRVGLAHVKRAPQWQPGHG
jgi:hypothetical protein